MDGTMFDRWARQLAGGSSRRGLLRAAGAVALAAVLGGAATGEAQTCIRDGDACNPKKARKCCSGTCTKNRRGHKCAPAPGAFGCTNSPAIDFCATRFAGTCPHHGGFCIVDENRHPLCVANTSGCEVTCATDADCVANTNFGATARCIKGCARCAGTTGGTTCVLPVS